MAARGAAKPSAGRAGGLTGALVLALLLGGLGAASAQEPPSTPAQPSSAPAQAPPPPPPAPEAAAAVPDRYVVEALRLSSAPVIDGRMDEPVWQQAFLVKDFVQYEPDAGAPATERTEARIGFDAEKLYVGVRCYDSRPDKMMANLMVRDGDLTYEDSVQIILDTFHDHANGFLFAVNPLGAKVDGLVRREGEEINLDWDGIWDVATSRDSAGWTAEFAIPLKTLRFPKTSPQTWGFNIRRFVARKEEDSYWKPLPRGNGFFGRYRISQFGEIRGIEGTTEGGHYQLVPYAAIKDRQRRGFEPHLTGDAGGDLKVNITSDLVADLTVHTDFAEAENDLHQVNLTRFNLFYPEKRAFFLEGANLFYFGDRGGNYESSDRFSFFFSRTIGLTPNGVEQIPVLGGAKISGNIGGLGLGFLNLTTAPVDFTDSYGHRIREPQTNYTVLRLKDDVYEGSTVGFIGLDKEGSGDRNQGGGIDWNLALAKHLSLAGFVAKTATPGLNGADSAGSADLIYETGVVRARSVYSEFGKNFNPELGFLTRNGIKKTQNDLFFYVYPNWDFLHRLIVINTLEHVTDTDGRLESQILKTELTFTLRNQAGLAFLTNDDIEVLPAPLLIHEKVIIPPGEYRFRNYFFGVQTDFAKPISGTVWYDVGDFYDGTRLHRLLYLVLRPFPGFQVVMQDERNDIRLREGSFITNVAYADITYSFTPTLSVRSLVQFSHEDSFEANLLVDWAYRPGTDFYFVYTGVRDLDPLRQLSNIAPLDPGRSFILKVKHRLDF